MFFNTQKYIGKKIGDYTVEMLLGEGRYGICFLAKKTTKKKL